jgi:hypothetical protein
MFYLDPRTKSLSASYWLGFFDIMLNSLGTLKVAIMFIEGHPQKH